MNGMNGLSLASFLDIFAGKRSGVAAEKKDHGCTFGKRNKSSFLLVIWSALEEDQWILIEKEREAKVQRHPSRMNRSLVGPSI